MYKGSLFSTSSPTFVICGLFDDSHCDRCEVIAHWHTLVLICKYTQGYKPFLTLQIHMYSTSQQCGKPSHIILFYLLPHGRLRDTNKNKRDFVHPLWARHLLRALHGPPTQWLAAPQRINSLTWHIFPIITSFLGLWWEGICTLSFHFSPSVPCLSC